MSLEWFKKKLIHFEFGNVLLSSYVATLVLVSQPRQGVARKPGFKAKALQGCKPRGRKPKSKGKGIARLQAKRKEARERRQRHWKGAGQEEARESSHTPGSLRNCEGVWGSEHLDSQGNSHFGKGSPGGLPKFQRASWSVKSQWIVALFIPLESSWNLDV
jgi:hypothetical protein